MTIKQRLYLRVAAIGMFVLLASAPVQLSAQTAAQTMFAIDDNDIGGVVTGANGPEAGVWVIAETNELPTKYAKMVVTDDLGRYAIPDLPTANYSVWVRGYGLVDSPKLRAKPGQHLDLKAVPAPTEAAAAHYYPAIYWYSMMKIPDQSQFGGKSNIPEKLTQVDWLKQMKNIGCIGCHQLGQESTRTIPAQFGHFKSGEEAWMRRVQSGQSGEQMTNQLAGNFGGAPFKYFGEWTDRIAKGELPHSKPLQPSAYWGGEKVWDTRANNHNAMFDKDGRVWLAAAVRGLDNPAFCKKGSEHPSAKVFPLDRSPRQVAILDPKTMKYTFVDTCFATHHLQFGYDDNDTLWFSGTGPVVGWLNTKMFDETGDTAKSQGWSPYVLDANGNGKRDDYVEPGQPTDPSKDMRIELNGLSGPYAVMPNPTDGSIWFTTGVFGGRPSSVLRFDPKTGLSEIYDVPTPAFGIRGGDIDGNGVVWASLSSGHLASFDRRKCKGPLNGPKATGDHCPEGWAFYKY